MALLSLEGALMGCRPRCGAVASPGEWAGDFDIPDWAIGRLTLGAKAPPGEWIGSNQKVSKVAMSPVLAISKIGGLYRVRGMDWTLHGANF